MARWIVELVYNCAAANPYVGLDIVLLWAYSICSELVSITPLFFKIQQVHNQPVVVTTSAAISSPTAVPKAGTLASYGHDGREME